MRLDGPTRQLARCRGIVRSSGESAVDLTADQIHRFLACRRESNAQGWGGLPIRTVCETTLFALLTSPPEPLVTRATKATLPPGVPEERAEPARSPRLSDTDYLAADTTIVDRVASQFRVMSNPGGNEGRMSPLCRTVTPLCPICRFTQQISVSIRQRPSAGFTWK